MLENMSDTWDYRVVRKTTEDGDEGFGVQEVYYDDVGKPCAHTTDLEITGDTIAGIRTTLQRMLWCLDKDVVDEIKSDVTEDNIEDRVLSLEIENAEMRDRLTELGDEIKERGL